MAPNTTHAAPSKNVLLYPIYLYNVNPIVGPTAWHAACANEKIPIPEPNFSVGKVSDAIAKQHVAVNALALPSSNLNPINIGTLSEIP